MRWLDRSKGPCALAVPYTTDRRRLHMWTHGARHTQVEEWDAVAQVHPVPLCERGAIRPEVARMTRPRSC